MLVFRTVLLVLRYKPGPVLWPGDRSAKRGGLFVMPCYHPITAWRSLNGRQANGAWPLVFNPNYGYRDMEVTVPCGQCIGCRLERSRQWAIRCVHEASLWPRNCFITLTYNDEFLPKDLSLDKRHFTLFMKRLRKRFGEGIRFYMCGEYGTLQARPHYHACLFNHDFEDKVLWSVRAGVKLYRSAELERLWPFGFSTIGDVTFESAAYVARYITKKITGPKADEHYQGREPEYTNMSRRPGIGRDWIDKYKEDVYPHDFVVMRNKKMRPPRYYDKVYDTFDPEEMLVIKAKRMEESKKYVADNTFKRRMVRKKVQELRLEKLVRPLE